MWWIYFNRPETSHRLHVCSVLSELSGFEQDEQKGLLGYFGVQMLTQRC